MPRFVSAQIDCTVGQINDNLELHYKLIKDAIELNADLIVFPEMSITGYWREKGAELSFDPSDSRLDVLKNLAELGNIIIIAGAPIRIDSRLYIGSFIFHPDNSIEIYTKQYLHKGEDIYYSSSFEYNPVISIGKENLSLAICADISNPDHARSAKLNGATLYIPSIFYSASGIVEGEHALKKYAEDHSMNVLMSNYCGTHWDMKSGGRSGFWNSNGDKKGQLETEGIGLLIADKVIEDWEISIVEKKK